MKHDKLNIAVVGLRFGGAFVPIYHVHPQVASVKVFDLNGELARSFAERGLCDGVYSSFDDMLSDAELDAVHLVTPIPDHARQAVAVLQAGKHCASTVPMATSLQDIRELARAVRVSGKNYMMMETTLYTYQYFYVQNMISSGELGCIQFMRGSHYQDMSFWPDYWMGLPPMWYGTHAIGPMVGLSGSRIRRVHAFGSGTMDPDLVRRYGNPYPVETAIFAFDNGMKAEATRSLFECARVYQEGLFVYGSKACFEWGFSDGDKPYVTRLIPSEDSSRRGLDAKTEVMDMPNLYQSLPEPLWPFTVGGNFDPLRPNETLKIGAGGGHHGSHPHLVHEFVMSILEERKPAVDFQMGANITAAGICAHMSAIADGQEIVVPEF
ncbi:MAG: Gfo/Idh/MocA family oxidoreductase [Clostridia bacterium]|nr:Gfo/Idh/MocA family oxidoreductase [Clostridia bacterium]